MSTQPSLKDSFLFNSRTSAIIIDETALNELSKKKLLPHFKDCIAEHADHKICFISNSKKEPSREISKFYEDTPNKLIFQNLDEFIDMKDAFALMPTSYVYSNTTKASMAHNCMEEVLPESINASAKPFQSLLAEKFDLPSDLDSCRTAIDKQKNITGEKPAIIFDEYVIKGILDYADYDLNGTDSETEKDHKHVKAFTTFLNQLATDDKSKIYLLTQSAGPSETLNKLKGLGLNDKVKSTFLQNVKEPVAISFCSNHHLSQKYCDGVSENTLVISPQDPRFAARLLREYSDEASQQKQQPKPAGRLELDR